MDSPKRRFQSEEEAVAFVQKKGNQAVARLQKMIDRVKSAVDEVFQGDYTHAPHSMEFDTFFGNVRIKFNQKNYKHEKISQEN